MVLSSEKSLYEILEVSISANAATIKASYRKLARKYHPDLNSGNKNCIEKFKEISYAYEILSDSEKKKNYDLLNGFHPSTFKNQYKQATKDETKNEEIFSNIFSDIMENFKKTTSSKNRDFKTKQIRPERGSDVHSEIEITLAESVQGTSKTINILHTETCANCAGRPFLNGSKCPFCDGKGEKSNQKKINVKIPKNIKHCSKIRIPNEGNKGYNGGKNGDLYLKIKIKQDSKFKYEGLNVFCTVPITPFEAVLGADIEIRALNGKINMKITPNTQSGQKFRLAGQGLEQNNQKGDMIVTVNIEVPQKPSEKELEIYKKLKDAAEKNIRDNND